VGGGMKKWRVAKRLQVLPPYLFAELDRLKKAAIARGADVISLGVGDPDVPTLPPIVAAMQEAVTKPEHHTYPFGRGMVAFRRAIAEWCGRRFGLDVDPEREVTALIGSKEGLGHLPLAFVNPGDITLVPDPGYPVYRNATIFAGGRPVAMPLRAPTWLPDFRRLPAAILKKTKLMFLNYPNNPTAATAPAAFFQEVVKLAKRYGFLVVHDAAYTEVSWGAERPMSFLSVPGAKAVGIELHSFSKTFHMTGWRLGFAVGQASAIAGLAQIKENLDSGVFSAIQEAGIHALNLPDSVLQPVRAMWAERMAVLAGGLREMGWDVQMPSATFYVWAKIPRSLGTKSISASRRILEECQVVVTPGVGFGKYGEGYVRMTTTVPVPRLQEALQRLKKLSPSPTPSLTKREKMGMTQGG